MKRTRFTSLKSIMIVLAFIFAFSSMAIVFGTNFKTSSADDTPAIGPTTYKYAAYNVTRDEWLKVDLKNTGRPTPATIVYYDNFRGQNNGVKWVASIACTPDANGVMRIKSRHASAGSTTAIPQDGFLLSGAAADMTLSNWVVGDEVVFYDNSLGMMRTTTKKNSNGAAEAENAAYAEVGYDMINATKEEAGTDPSVILYTSDFGAATPAFDGARDFIEVNADGAVTAVTAAGAAGTTKAIAAGAKVIVMNGAIYTDWAGTRMHFGAGVTSVYFEEMEAAVIEAEATSGDANGTKFNVTGLNPRSTGDVAGKAVIYVNKEGYAANKTVYSEDHINYIIAHNGTANAIIAKSEGPITCFPYNSLVLSVPSSMVGYDTLNVGDTVAVPGTPAISYPELLIEHIKSGARGNVTGKNGSRWANNLRLVNTPEGGATGMNAWGLEVGIAPNNGRYVVTAVGANVNVPVGGFTLSAHGVSIYNFLKLLQVGDVIKLYDPVAPIGELSGIKIGGEDLEGFAKETLAYTVTLPYTYNPEYDEDAVPPEITFVATLQAEVKTTKTETGAELAVYDVHGNLLKTYIITWAFESEPSHDPDLTGITVNGSNIASFGNSTLTYNYVFPYGTATDVEITVATTSNVGATSAVVLSGTFAGGDRKATVTVTSAYGGEDETRVFEINFTIAAPSTDSSLSGITIDGVALPGFDSETLNYTYTSPKYSKTVVPVITVTAAANATYVTATDWATFPGSATITVTAQDGTTQTVYTINYTLPFLAIENITKGTLSTVDLKNSNRGANTLIYYDAYRGTLTGTNPWGKAVVVAPDAEGVLKVTAVYASGDASARNTVIPKNGFVLSEYSTAPRLDGYAVGDVVVFHDNSIGSFKNFATYNSNTHQPGEGMPTEIPVHVELPIHFKNLESDTVGNNIILYTPEFGAKTPSYSWRTVFTVTASGAFTKSPASATAKQFDIPEGGYVIVIHGDIYSDGYVSNYPFNPSSISPYLDVAGTADLKLTKDTSEFTVGLINPRTVAGLGGSTAVYITKAGYTMAKSFATAGRVNYAVTIVDGVHKVTAKNTAAVEIPKNGYVLSIPSSVTGYDSLAVNDILTASGTTTLTVPTGKIVNKGGIRAEITGKDIARGADQIIMYTKKIGTDATATGTNAYGYEVAVTITDGKYIVSEVSANVAAIPANGFVLSGHGIQYHLFLKYLGVGDELNIEFSNIATLSSITVGATAIPGFAAGTDTYSFTLPYGTVVAGLPTVTAVTSDAGATFTVTNPTALPGALKITVTAEDRITTKEYTVNYTIAAPSTVATLSAIKLNGTEIADFAPDTLTYTIKLPYDTTTKSVITATATDANATVTVSALDAVTGTVTITVTAQDGTTIKTYTVTIGLEDAPKKGCGSIGYSGGSALLFTAILMIACLAFILKKRGQIRE